MSLKKKFSRIFLGKESKDYSWDSPSLELSPEREEQIIETIANKVEKYGLKTPTLLFLRSYKPASVYGAQISPAMLGPFFMLLEMFNIESYDYNAFFMKRENIDRLIKRIEEI